MPNVEKLPPNNENRKLERLALEEETVGVDEQAFESWRIFKIMAEFVEGFELLRKYGLSATFFGSARCELGDKTYENAAALSKKLAEHGFAVVTGGGFGVMEAANRGAKEAGGVSIGLNIQLPHEQLLNRYTTVAKSFHYFFTRKVMLAYAAEVYIFFPGGFGTMDEFFEIATLVQTRKISPVPIVLFGKEYWTPLLSWIQREFVEHSKTIDPEDATLYHLVDSVDEAFDYIQKSIEIPEFAPRVSRRRTTRLAGGPPSSSCAGGID